MVDAPYDLILMINGLKNYLSLNKGKMIIFDLVKWGHGGLIVSTFASHL